MREKQLMLVVDDVSLNRVAFREMFKNNYEIIEAENGEVALKKIVENSHRLAMIILDLLMPVMDGLALLEIMQKNEKYKIIPVVAVTDNEQFRLDALRRGAWDFISKSNSREVIVARIENVISRRELVNERQKSAVLEKKVEDVRAESAGDMLKSVRKIYNNSPVAFSVAEVQTDAKGNPCGMVIRFANKACADLEGASVEEMYDHEYCKLRLAKDPQRLELYGQVAKSGAAQTFEREISQDKFIRVNCYCPLLGFCACVLTDISGEKRAKNELTRVNLKMQNLVNSIPGGIGIYRVGEKIKPIYYTDGVCALTGETRAEYEEKVGDDVSVCIFEGDLSRLKKEIAASINEERPINILTRVNHKNGSTVWVQMNAVKIGIEDGEPLFHAVLTGISKETQMYQNLLTESTSSIYVINTENYELLYCNEKTFELAEVEGKNYQGRKCYEMLARCDAPCDDCQMGLMTADGFFERTLTNEKNGKIYSVKGKMMEWNGIKANIEYLTDISETVNAQKMVEMQLAKEACLVSCIGCLTSRNDFAETVRSILQNVCEFYGADGGAMMMFDVNDYKIYKFDNYKKDPKSVGIERETMQNSKTITQIRVGKYNYQKKDMPLIKEKNKEGYDILTDLKAENLRYISYDIDEVRRVLLVVYNVADENQDLEFLERLSYFTKNEMIKRMTERKLGEATAKLNGILKSVSGALAIHDPAAPFTGLIFMTDGWYNLTGFTVEELFNATSKGQRISTVQEDLDRLHITMVEAAKEKKDIDMEVRAIHKKGDLIWLRYRAVCVEKEGKLLYYGFYIDITKEKEALIILEKQYQRAISYSDNVKIQGFISSMLVNLSENKVEEYSDTEKFKKIVQKGYSYDEVNLHNTSIFWADKKNYQQKCSLSSTSLINAFNTGRTTVEQEWQMCMDDGKINWVKTTVKLTKKPNTKDVFAFIYTQNIHKEKIANYIVNHAATKVSDMIMYIESTTGDFVCYKKGLKEPISSANYDEVIEDAIRREIQGFTGEDIEIIIKEMKLSNILRELESKEDYVFVTHFKDKNGKYQCKKMQFSYLDKTLGSIIHVRTDVTELYEQEQEKKEVLTHALQAAEQANKAKSRFLSSMSHDIRTPMNAIIGMSQLAQYDLDDKKQVAESLAIIDNSSRHLLDLINDVLDMSKIESGGIKLQMEKISIRHEMDNIYQMMYSSFAAKRQELKLKVEIKHDRVIGDKSRMHRVLINLLGNALKFTQDGGRVEICAEEIETDSEKLGKYRFSVSDNGQGIAKENFENIFKPFVREGVAAINHIEGTGLGLSIVKSIVEACGGIIYVDSEVGKGSRFTIEISQLLDDNTLTELPIVTKEEQQINAMPKMKGLHVLLVEDHPVNTLVAQKMFEKCGAIVDTAENGQIGCDKFCNSENGYYDIIFMDIQMPVMNGYDATGVIRASNHPQGKSIPIVAMTANAFAQDVRESENAGMNGHIAKPISPLSISKVIKTLNLER